LPAINSLDQAISATANAPAFDALHHSYSHALTLLPAGIKKTALNLQQGGFLFYANQRMVDCQ